MNVYTFLFKPLLIIHQAVPVFKNKINIMDQYQSLTLSPQPVINVNCYQDQSRNKQTRPLSENERISITFNTSPTNTIWISMFTQIVTKEPCQLANRYNPTSGHQSPNRAETFITKSISNNSRECTENKPKGKPSDKRA